MKKDVVISIIISVIFIVLVIFFSVDYIRVKSNKSPIFSIPIFKYQDGGSVEYFGLGYKVIKYVNNNLNENVEYEYQKMQYRIGTLFMKFDNPYNNSYGSVVSPDVKNIKYKAFGLKTHLYIEDFNSPSSDIIKSVDELEQYKLKFVDDELYQKLNKYDSDYFKNNVLVIVTIQESSGSNTNEVDRVSKLNKSDDIDIFVKRTEPQIGTDDMAMWHLFVEFDKNVFTGINKVSVVDSNTKYL